MTGQHLVISALRVGLEAAGIEFTDDCIAFTQWQENQAYQIVQECLTTPDTKPDAAGLKSPRAEVG